MKTIYFIAILGLTLQSCSSSKATESGNGSVAKYTYAIDKWENLGKQTLVDFHFTNPSSLDQSLSVTLEAINKSGERFKKDTTIHLVKGEFQKTFQIVLDTEGEIEKVDAVVHEVQ